MKNREDRRGVLWVTDVAHHILLQLATDRMRDSFFVIHDFAGRTRSFALNFSHFNQLNSKIADLLKSGALDELQNLSTNDIQQLRQALSSGQLQQLQKLTPEQLDTLFSFTDIDPTVLQKLQELDPATIDQLTALSGGDFLGGDDDYDYPQDEDSDVTPPVVTPTQTTTTVTQGQFLSSTFHLHHNFNAIL